jgi:hypothetical protein
MLELIANRKTVLGAHHADHEKMGMTEEQLAQAHAVLDAKRLTLVNRISEPHSLPPLFPLSFSPPPLLFLPFSCFPSLPFSLLQVLFSLFSFSPLFPFPFSSLSFSSRKEGGEKGERGWG